MDETLTSEKQTEIKAVLAAVAVNYRQKQFQTQTCTSMPEFYCLTCTGSGYMGISWLTL